MCQEISGNMDMLIDEKDMTEIQMIDVSCSCSMLFVCLRSGTKHS